MFNEGLYAIVPIWPQQLPLIKSCAEPFLGSALVNSSSHNMFVEVKQSQDSLVDSSMLIQTGWIEEEMIAHLLNFTSLHPMQRVGGHI